MVTTAERHAKSDLEFPSPASMAKKMECEPFVEVENQEITDPGGWNWNLEASRSLN